VFSKEKIYFLFRIELSIRNIVLWGYVGILEGTERINGFLKKILKTNIFLEQAYFMPKQIS
jgi:hypothetical protein